MKHRFFATLGITALLMTPFLASAASPSSWLTAEQKLRADHLISEFENGTPTIQYGYVENLHDGRGFTVGRGFTTADGEASVVVQRYVAQKPTAPIAKYLPRLKQLAKSGSGSTSGLSGFASAWKAAAKDPIFCAVQDGYNDELSYVPAMRLADVVGLKTALARVEVYDALVMHGDGDDPDGVPALLSRASKAVGGNPASGVDEKIWLRSFLKVRRADLLNPANTDTQDEWSQAVGRVDVVSTLLDAKNMDFHGPLHITGEFATDIP